MQDVQQQGPFPDPLREGLVVLAKQLGVEVSSQELGDGMALEQGRLPLALVTRAMRRAQIEARLLRTQVLHIAPRLLPMLLLLNDGGTALLLQLTASDAELLIPDTGGVERISHAELAKRYAGIGVVARLAYQPDDRAQGFAKAKNEHWLKGPVKQRWRAWLEVGVGALTANVLAVFTAIFAMQVYDRVVPNAAYDTLWILSSGVALAIIIEFLLRVLRAHLLDITGKSLDLELSSKLFSHVMQLRLSAKPRSTGAFSSQIREFESVREFFTSTTVGAISDLPFVLIFLGVIAFIGGPVAWVPFAAVILMVLPGVLAQGYMANLSRQNLREGAVRQGVLLESIEHLETVKATRAEGRNVRLWETMSSSLSDVGVKVRRASSLLSLGANLVQQLCYVGVVIVGVYQIGAGHLTMGGLIACSILGSRAVSPMAQVAGILARWQHVKVSAEGLDDLLKAPVERPHGQAFVKMPHLKGDYALESLNVVLEDGAPAVLNIAQLSIKSGEKIALLGGNGAGKSTLLRILSGLSDPTQGRVVLDGINLLQIEPADRRRQIGYLPQDIALFYGTLRENLTLDGASHTDEELLGALSAVGLENFVRKHPLGLDLPIQGSGSVSGGQRQAIGLARLILQDPKIVLLDEPTAAFDQNNEANLIGFLKQWQGTRTVVISTHKKAVLELTQRAIVLREGRVEQDDAVSKIVSGNQVRSSRRTGSSRGPSGAGQ